MRMNLRQAVQHLNAASVVCEVAKIVGCGARFLSESDAAYLGWAAAEVGSPLLHCIEASDVGLLDYSWMWLDLCCEF